MLESKDLIRNNQTVKSDKVTKILFIVALATLLTAQIIVMIAFGAAKAGYHEDELYSYFSTNRSVGLMTPDREWQSAETIRKEFTVTAGERFNFGMVKTVQSWDVHPPLYYYLLHIMSSLFAGVFSKWIGIGVNLIAFALSFIVLAKIMELLGVPRPVEFIVLAFVGLNPMTISGVMFIRMYMWLTLFVLLSAYLHLRLLFATVYTNAAEILGRKGMFIHYILPIMIVSFLGFMTQYYYLIFWAFAGAFYCLIRLITKTYYSESSWTLDSLDVSESGSPLLIRFWDVLTYVCGSVIAFAFGVAYYPASAAQILHGYRGKEAIGEFADASNIVTRLSFFMGLLNKFVFSWGLILIVVLIIATTVMIFIVANSSGFSMAIFGLYRRYTAMIYLGLVCLCYFLVVAKTALLLGATSNRYQMPIYPLVIMLLLVLLYDQLGKIAGMTKKLRKTVGVVGILMAVVLLTLDVIGMSSDHVLFLYDKTGNNVSAQAREYPAQVCVLYNPASSENVWRLGDELMTYDEVYYMNEENLDPITDPKLVDADRIIVYIADDDDQEQAIDNILSSCSGVNTYEEVYARDMWKTLIFSTK